MKNKKHYDILDDYDKQKAKHLEKLGNRCLATEEKLRILRDKKMKGNFLKNF
tara:strand:- start:2146 stop:2301 length:156 start_codon:yes stop_codon:yes gene_type:complete